MSYFITGVWKNDNGAITHVYLHQHDLARNQFYTGQKTTEAEAIRLIRANNVVRTLRWDYASATWLIGALVQVVGTPPYLRTVADATVIDNLDNMINMNGFI